MTTQRSGTGRGVQGKPGRRYELTDDAWERIEPLLPKQVRGGRWNDHRITLNGIFWILNSGAQWRDLPDRHGKWRERVNVFRVSRRPAFAQGLYLCHVSHVFQSVGYSSGVQVHAPGIPAQAAHQYDVGTIDDQGWAMSHGASGKPFLRESILHWRQPRDCQKRAQTHLGTVFVLFVDDRHALIVLRGVNASRPSRLRLYPETPPL